jgi:hypothetical protein
LGKAPPKRESKSVGELLSLPVLDEIRHSIGKKEQKDEDGDKNDTKEKEE